MRKMREQLPMQISAVGTDCKPNRSAKGSIPLSGVILDYNRRIRSFAGRNRVTIIILQLHNDSPSARFRRQPIMLSEICRNMSTVSENHVELLEQ